MHYAFCINRIWYQILLVRSLLSLIIWHTSWCLLLLLIFSSQMFYVWNFLWHYIWHHSIEFFEPILTCFVAMLPCWSEQNVLFKLVFILFHLLTRLPGKALASNQQIWLSNAQFADSKLFSRSLLAKVGWIDHVSSTDVFVLLLCQYNVWTNSFTLSSNLWISLHWMDCITHHLRVHLSRYNFICYSRSHDMSIIFEHKSC